ncbi:hypothetical protein ACFL14_02460 [Patescibacteria group bacterium]
MRQLSSIIAIVFLLLAVTSCTAGKDNAITTPDLQIADHQSSTTNTYLLGYWDFYWDGSEFEIVPIRSADWALNILRFLEPPVLTGLNIGWLEVDPDGLGNNDIMDVELVIDHPLNGLPQYNVFDTWGIIISDGDTYDFIEQTELYDPEGFNIPPMGNDDIRIAGPDDIQLLNADGYSTLFNQYEYENPGTGNYLFYYIDGLMIPAGDLNATLNPYKYFGDGISTNQYPLTYPPSSRGVFRHYKVNSRMYRLQRGDGKSWWTPDFHFSYAVCVHWNEPNGSVFPADANADCPIFLQWPTQGKPGITGLTTQGGLATVECKVHDWQIQLGEQDWNDIELRVEAPGLFLPKAMSHTGDGNFSIEVSNELGGELGSDYIVLITAQSGTEKNFQLIRGIEVEFEDSNWNTPTQIDSSADAENPYLQTLGTTLYCAWINNSNIMWSEYNNTDWTTDTLIAGEDEPATPRFIFDSADQVHIVWKAKQSGSGDIFYETFDPTDDFPLPPYFWVDEGLGQSYNCPGVCLVSQDVYVFWHGTNGTSYKYPIYERHQDTGIWQNAEIFSDPPDENCRRVRCITDSSDDIHAVWQSDMEGDGICYTFWDTAYDPIQTLIPSSGDYPDICIINSTVWITWHQNEGTFYTSFLVGSSPTGQNYLIPGSGGEPQLVFDGNNLLVFWIEGQWISGAVLDGENPGITLHQIAGPVNDSGTFYDFSVIADSSGTFHVVWADDNDTDLWHTYSL